MNLYTNPLTYTDAHRIVDALPRPRRQAYLDIAKKHAETEQRIIILAAELYLWNGYLASVVDRTTGEVEVLLRNFIDRALAQWNSKSPQNGSPEWLTNPEGKLKELVIPSEGTALKEYGHTQTVGGIPTHDDYVAGLTFGNWVHLLPKKHARENNARVILWNEAFAPHLNSPDRVDFQQRVMAVKDIRNRATHRRPLIKDTDAVSRTHQDCVTIAKAINEDLGIWLRNEKWIPQALKQSPLL
ncbi:hypothetical protein [Corynebacterium striatum]|uniref:hypothetical protein n=1 Tax=Corynebacterium striatum TaxID=43770 RepID=UPI003AC9FDAC